MKPTTRLILYSLVIALAATLPFPLNIIQAVLGLMAFAATIVKMRQSTKRK